MKANMRLLRIVALLFCVIALSACEEPEPEERNLAVSPPTLSLPDTDSPFQLGELLYDEKWDSYELDYGSFPRIDGCDSCLPLARAFARFHLKLSDNDLGKFIEFTGDPIRYLTNTTYAGQSYLSEQGIYMKGKPTDLVLSTALTKSDYAEAEANGIELLVEPIAVDGVVLYVSPENPVSSLTSEQIRGIYTGRITNWKEVGGDDLPIIAYQSGDSNAKQAISAQVMQGDWFMEGPSTENTIPSGIPGGDSYTVAYPAKYDNTPEALGYELMLLGEEMDGIKVLSVDGVLPGIDTVQSGAYPLTVTYNAILRVQDQEGVSGEFLSWILSDEGQRCILDAGYALPNRAQTSVSS